MKDSASEMPDDKEAWKPDPAYLAVWRERMRLAVRRLKRHSSTHFDTSDIVQEGMIQLTQGLDDFRGRTEAEFDAWIGQIARGHAINAERKQHAKRRDVRSEMGGIVAGLAGSHQSPLELAAREETIQQLSEAIQQLDERQQTVLLRHVFDKETFVEIAKTLGCSQLTVSRLHKQAIAALSEIMNNRGADDGS